MAERIKMPNTIHGGGHSYRMSRVQGLLEARNSCALTNHVSLYLKLDDGKPNSVMALNLFHEIVHIAAEVYLNDGKRVTEGACDAIAQMMVQFFQDLGIELDFSDLPTEDVG